jgi:hypothetical protein
VLQSSTSCAFATILPQHCYWRTLDTHYRHHTREK